MSLRRKSSDANDAGGRETAKPRNMGPTPSALLGGSVRGSCGTPILPLESQCLWMKDFDFAEPTASL